MVRRLFVLLALVAASYASVACTNPTAPKMDCTTLQGSGTCSSASH